VLPCGVTATLEVSPSEAVSRVACRVEELSGVPPALQRLVCGVAQLEAGRAFVRLQLQATALGLATQPPSQVLQEYAEMQPLQREFEQLVGQRPGDKVQMLVRIGLPSAQPPHSPRRPLDAFIRA